MTTRKKSDLLILFSIVAGDAAAIFLALLAAYALRFHSVFPVPYGVPPFGDYVRFFPLVTALLLFALRGFRLYERHWSLVASSEPLQIVKATLAGQVAVIVFAFALKNVLRSVIEYSTGVAVLSTFTVAVFLIGFRRAFGRFEVWYFRRRGLCKRLVVIGTDDRAHRLVEQISSRPQLCYDIVGVITEAGGIPPSPFCGVPVLGTLDDAPRLLVQGAVDEVILSMPRLEHARKSDLILHCEKEFIDFRLIPDVFEILTANVELVSIDGVPLMGLKGSPLDSAWNRLLKRFLDVCGSLSALTVTAPLMAAISFFIKRDSPGPVIYAQERCGEDGCPFTLYKFRTMRADAEKESGPRMAAWGDPRCTRVGRFLRRHNLDELPQLVNVLKGDMSLVGPRPERPHFIAQFKHLIPRYFSRHHVKAGLTGWAQVNGLRQNTSLDERIRYDLYYIENWSLLFDLKILLLTLLNTKNGY